MQARAEMTAQRSCGGILSEGKGREGRIQAWLMTEIFLEKPQKESSLRYSLILVLISMNLSDIRIIMEGF